jgi:hypothetical protein
MFKQYISLVSELPKIDEPFYFRPSKTAYKIENSPIGIHKLNSIVPFLMKEAGLEIKTAHRNKFVSCWPSRKINT